MNKRNDIQEELKGWNSPLADMSRAMPYYVPQGYFAGLDKDIIAGVKAAGAAEPLPLWGKQMPYSVPQGYFNTLPDQLLAVIHDTDPALHLPGEHSMQVPEGYFEQLPAQILAAAKAADAGHTPIKPRFIALHTYKWRSIKRLAAAVLVLGIGFMTYRTLDQPRPLSTEQQLAALPQDSISHYVIQHIDEFDAESIETAIAANTNNNNKLDASSLSDEEIKQFLDENGWDAENSETL